MKPMKKLLIFAAICTLLCLCAVCAGAVQETADFVPVLRFVASSDTHIREGDNMTYNRIGKMMEEVYAVAENDPNYQNVDALLVCGDLTNDGTKAEFERFQAAIDGAIKDGTKFLGVTAMAHDGMGMWRTKMLDLYSELSGNEPNFHVVIGGYHFIGVSVSRDMLEHYDLGQLTWLKKQLDAAVAEDPDKPVFVMHHEHNLSTVYGSSLYDRWGVPYFNAILKQYPQVVDFSGHSHYPLNDPRSIWQGDFTAVGTGGLYYAEFTVDAWRKVRPAGAYDTATCWIAELNAQNDLRLRALDIEANEFLCEYLLKNPADPANRDYTPAKREAASTAPVFAKTAALTVTPAFGSCKVEIPAAASTDGMPVVLYRVTATDKHGFTAAKEWVLPQYFRAVEQTSVALDLKALAAGEYTIRAVAETAYGVQSAPLETKVTLEGNNAFVNFFERVEYYGKKLGDLIIHAF